MEHVSRCLLTLLVLALGCASASGPSAREAPPGFTPYLERIAQANRSVLIVAERPDTTTGGDRLYYIAYVTDESVEFLGELNANQRGYGDALWGEMQALGLQRQKTLDPAAFRYLVIDGRRHPGTPDAPARRTVFESENGKWVSYRFSHFVLRH
jgi:hypothetical protein